LEGLADATERPGVGDFGGFFECGAEGGSGFAFEDEELEVAGQGVPEVPAVPCGCGAYGEVGEVEPHPSQSQGGDGG
jgi:hypothetical protein